jgi:hypothetical protein
MWPQITPGIQDSPRNTDEIERITELMASFDIFFSVIVDDFFLI